MKEVNFNKFCYGVTLLSGVIFVSLFFYGTPLPSPSSVVPEIARGFPEQVELSGAAPFTIERGTYRYTLVPHASYTLRGLVVSLHHSDSFIDVSHKDDPANTVDVCVVWGPNITTNGYRMVSYAHGDFTCYYSWKGENDPPFSGEFLSNNHIVPETAELAALIKSVKVGDQIELVGELVDYRVTEGGELLGQRSTSLIRTDVGNGACEILYLTEARIIARNMPWHGPVALGAGIVFVLSLIIGFFVSMPKYFRIKKGTRHVVTPNPNDPTNFIK